MALQGSSQPGELVSWEDPESWADWADYAEQCAQKAVEIVNAAAQASDAAGQVAGVLLALPAGSPQVAEAGYAARPAHLPAQQLALVYALSQRLDFESVLRSSPWLAQQILCSAAQASPGTQMLDRLQERVVQAMLSELGREASNFESKQTIFATTAARCGLEQLTAVSTALSIESCSMRKHLRVSSDHAGYGRP